MGWLWVWVPMEMARKRYRSQAGWVFVSVLLSPILSIVLLFWLGPIETISDDT